MIFLLIILKFRLQFLQNYQTLLPDKYLRQQCWKQNSLYSKDPQIKDYMFILMSGVCPVRQTICTIYFGYSAEVWFITNHTLDMATNQNARCLVILLKDVCLKFFHLLILLLSQHLLRMVESIAIHFLIKSTRVDNYFAVFTPKITRSFGKSSALPKP